jgi:hypothetical protein
MSVFESNKYDIAMRKLNSCVHTLYTIADLLEEMEDPDEADTRADLVITAENLIDISVFVTERAREIGWQYTPVPEREDLDFDDEE